MQKKDYKEIARINKSFIENINDCLIYDGVIKRAILREFISTIKEQADYFEREDKKNTINYSDEVIIQVMEENKELVNKYGLGCGKEISKRKGNQECRETHLCKDCHNNYLHYLRIKKILESGINNIPFNRQQFLKECN